MSWAVDLTMEQWQHLNHCVFSFDNHYLTALCQAVMYHCQYIPKSLLQLQGQCRSVVSQPQSQPINDGWFPVVKTCVLWYRRRQVSILAEQLAMVTDLDIQQ